MQCPNRILAILRNTDEILQPATCCPSKNCPVFVSFGAVYGTYATRPYNRVCAILRNTDAILQLGTCEGSKNGSVYATVGDVWWGVCNTPLQSGTCGPSKNYPVFVPFGAACGAYAIRSYNRIRAILRNTDAISRVEEKGRFGCGAVGATACGGDGRE